MIKLINPVPGTTWKNNGGYDADTGLDIICPAGTKIISPADGILEYAEVGHTNWYEDQSSMPGFQPPYSIRIKLDTPLVIHGITYRWMWFTHLSEVSKNIKGAKGIQVKAGQVLGKTGIGNKVHHLHIGLIEDRKQTRTLPHRVLAEMFWGKRK